MLVSATSMSSVVKTTMPLTGAKLLIPVMLPTEAANCAQWAISE